MGVLANHGNTIKARWSKLGIKKDDYKIDLEKAAKIKAKYITKEAYTIEELFAMFDTIEDKEESFYFGFSIYVSIVVTNPIVLIAFAVEGPEAVLKMLYEQ